MPFLPFFVFVVFWCRRGVFGVVVECTSVRDGSGTVDAAVGGTLQKPGKNRESTKNTITIITTMCDRCRHRRQG